MVMAMMMAMTMVVTMLSIDKLVLHCYVTQRAGDHVRLDLLFGFGWHLRRPARVLQRVFVMWASLRMPQGVLDGIDLDPEPSGSAQAERPICLGQLFIVFL